MRKLVLTCAFLLAIASSAQAAGDEQKEVQELYRRGLRGDAAAVVQCIEKLETALRLDPANQRARVYLGSSYTLRSRDLGFGPQKLKTLNQGVALMDQAVAAAPNDGKLRLARALTVQSLPFFLGRAASARQDFAALAEMAERNPAQFDQGDAQIIFHQAALAAVKSGDRGRGAALFRQALQHPSDSALARKSEAELALLK